MTDNNSHTASSSNFPPSDPAKDGTGWVETTLGEVIDFVVDNRGKTPPLVESGYELLEVNAISDNAREPDYSKVSKFVDEEVFTNGFRKGTIKKGDVLIPTVGTIGNASYSKLDRGAIAQNLIALRANNQNDSLFLYYFLTDPNTKKALLNLDIGGVQPSIKVPHLLGMQVVFPPLPEQQAIASVLSAFDDKIELLREQNKTLEEMGQVIFQEWFGKYGVDDDKVNAEGREGGLGQLPEGWRVGKLLEIIDIFGGLAYKAEFLDQGNNILLTMGSVTAKDRFNYGGYKQYGGPFSDKNILKPGDLILATRDVTQDKQLIGAVAMVPDNLQCENIIGATNVYLVRNKGVLENDFLYYVFKSSQYREWIQGACKGTTIVMIIKEDVLNYEFIIPDKKTIDEFTEIVKNLREKRWQNDGQIQSLARSRDELLPRLMSGVVRVNDFSNN